MPHPLSVRITEKTRDLLTSQARRAGMTAHALAVRFVDEGTRTGAHPLVRFEDRGEGRRAVVGGLELWQVIVEFLYAQEDVALAAIALAVSADAVEAAVAYYGDYPDEIDELLSAALRDRDARHRNESSDFGAGVAALERAPGRAPRRR